MKSPRWQLITVAVLLAATAAPAQDPTGGTPGPAEIARTLAGTNSIPFSPVPASVLAGLSQADVFSEVVPPLLTTILRPDQTNGLAGFINDWHLRPKIFHVNNGASQNELLGLEYRYEKSVANRVMFTNSSNPLGVAFTLNARGDIATVASQNPNNFLESGVALHFFRGIGGIQPNYRPTREAQLALQKLVLTATTNQVAYAEAVRQFSTYMTPQFFWDLQGHATLEADQQFINKQWTYGGKLALVYRDWKAKSEVGWYNLLDYPFAAVRWLVDQEDFQPSGRTFPSAVVGLDLVDPANDGIRLAVDPETQFYPRARVELAFKTPVFRWQHQRLYISAAYRYFQELGAPGAIRSARLDQFQYFSIKLDLPYQFNISYSTGKLPLNQNSSQVYALGWAVNF